MIAQTFFLCLALVGLACAHNLNANSEDQALLATENSIATLSQQLKEQPDNEKLMFQLAQAYENKHDNTEAIRWYKARIDKGGDKEEVWGSLYKIGEIYNAMGFWDHALLWYQKAYQESPNRAEPLYKIAQHYRYNGDNHLAYLYAVQGSAIPLPKESKLFLSPALYDYQFDEELSICAFYTPFKEEGRAAADRLILKKGVPWPVKDQAYKNMIFYAPFLKDAKIQEIKIDLPLIREGLNERYCPLNPSIRKTAEGYRMICRTVNYERFGETGFKTRDPHDGTIKTRNFLLEYDPQFNLLSQKEIVENFPRDWRICYEGLEDCRIFSWQGQDWMTCATIGTHAHTIGQTLCKLCGETTGPTISLDKFIPIKRPNDYRCEKNWLPFIRNNQLFMIYGYDPFIVYKIDTTCGDYKTAISYQPPLDFSHLRGSASPIEFDQGYLVSVHEVVFNQNAYYMHRFLQLDKDFNLMSMSKPFFFKHKGVEFCCGMTLDHSNKNLILTIGVEDREAYVVTVDRNVVRAMLEPISPSN